MKQDQLVLSLHKVRNIEMLLKEADIKLERIQRNLSEYLESKRKFFPRFYFLSNEDLIEILGDSQKPERIQKHLKKIFEGVDAVGFVEPTLRGQSAAAA